MKALTQSMLVAALVMSAAVGGFARAETATQNISLKSEFVSVTVTIDDAIKSHPELTTHLVTEGKQWAQRNYDATQRDAQKSPAAYSNGWSYSRNYSLVSTLNGRYLSVLMSESQSTDAPFPLSGFKGYIWDSQASTMVGLDTFFTDLNDNGPALTAIRSGIIKELAAERKLRDHVDPPTPQWYREILPTRAGIGDITLEPSTEAGKSSGLSAIYEPYTFGTEFDEEYVAFVPWLELAPHLNEQGKSVFAGSRPTSDKATDK